LCLLRGLAAAGLSISSSFRVNGAVSNGAHTDAFGRQLRRAVGCRCSKQDERFLAHVHVGACRRALRNLSFWPIACRLQTYPFGLRRQTRLLNGRCYAAFFFRRPLDVLRGACQGHPHELTTFLLRLVLGCPLLNLNQKRLPPRRKQYKPRYSTRRKRRCPPGRSAGRWCSSPRPGSELVHPHTRPAAVGV
jgi:hypothetical protein